MICALLNIPCEYYGNFVRHEGIPLQSPQDGCHGWVTKLTRTPWASHAHLVHTNLQGWTLESVTGRRHSFGTFRGWQWSEQSLILFIRLEMEAHSFQEMADLHLMYGLATCNLAEVNAFTLNVSTRWRLPNDKMFERLHWILKWLYPGNDAFYTSFIDLLGGSELR